MKNILLYFALIVLVVGCKKVTTTTNNYITTEHFAAFTVEGLNDIFLSQSHNTSQLSLAIRYTDSAQQKVKLSLSDMPQGIICSFSGPTSGYPTFGTTIRFWDTSSIAPAALGVYNVLLTVESENGMKKQFPFKITVRNPELCGAKFAGIFNYCHGASTFKDTVSVDAAEPNKIWFTNFANTSKKVFVMCNCEDASFTIPRQVVGGVEFSGTGSDVITGYGGTLLVFSATIDSVNKTIIYN